MTTKERLIEELKKYNWFIDTYEDFNRVAALKSILLCYTNKLINNYGFLASPCRWVGSIDKSNEVIFLVEVDSQYIDINQLFNEYLEEYEHHVWQHSVLSAMQLGLKVECKGIEAEEWVNCALGSSWNDGTKYRIDYKEEVKLVTDEIWDLLVNDYKYIAKDENGEIWTYTNEPEIINSLRDGDKGFWSIENGTALNIDHLKCFSAKKDYVDWEKSLCIRPNNDK